MFRDKFSCYTLYKEACISMINERMRTLTNKTKLTFLALVSTGILGACGSQTADEEQSSSSQVSSETSETEESSSESAASSEETSSNSATGQGINEQEFDVSLDDAVAIYNENHPNTSVESITFDEDSGKYEYDFDGFDDTSEYGLTVDAATGEVSDKESDTEDDDDSNEALTLDNILTPQEAMTAALEEVNSGYVDEWQLKTDNGMTVYEISIEDSQKDDDDIVLNAETGEIVER